LFWYVILG